MDKEKKNKLLNWLLAQPWFIDIEDDLYIILLERWKQREENREIWDNKYNSVVEIK